MGSPHEGSIRRPIANMVNDKGVYNVVYNKDKDNDNNGDCDEDNTYLPYNYITRVPLFIIYWQLDMSYLVIVPTLRGTLQYCSICSLGCSMCSTSHEATYYDHRIISCGALVGVRTKTKWENGSTSGERFNCS